MMMKIRVGNSVSLQTEESYRRQFGGNDLRKLLIGNSQFRNVWIGGKRYEMPKEETNEPSDPQTPPSSSQRSKA